MFLLTRLGLVRDEYQQARGEEVEAEQHADGALCTHVTNTVAIRPQGYKSQPGAYTPPEV